MIEVFSLTTGTITRYDDLNDARVKIAATLNDNDPNRIRFTEVMSGKNRGKYYYKLLFKSNVAITRGHLTLYSEEDTVQSLLYAYLDTYKLPWENPHDNVRIVYLGKELEGEDLENLIERGEDRYFFVAKNPDKAGEAKTQPTANRTPNKLELRF